MLDPSHTPVNSKLVEIKLACVHPASLFSGQIYDVAAFVSNFPRPHDHTDQVKVMLLTTSVTP